MEFTLPTFPRLTTTVRRQPDFSYKKKKKEKKLCSDARFALGMDDDKADSGLYTLQIIPVLHFVCTINSQPSSLSQESSIFAKKGQ